ncbi:hypothetical protein K438DRAFT_1851390 [Mycena galopus ATCC 62051]|nr:hypothetical protein K438DRAFT_1851390 [Mycena galopus ATCC 62051]
MHGRCSSSRGLASMGLGSAVFLEGSSRSLSGSSRSFLGTSRDARFCFVSAFLVSLVPGAALFHCLPTLVLSLRLWLTPCFLFQDLDEFKDDDEVSSFFLLCWYFGYFFSCYCAGGDVRGIHALSRSASSCSRGSSEDNLDEVVGRLRVSHLTRGTGQHRVRSRGLR